MGCLLLAIVGVVNWVWPVYGAIQLEYFDTQTVGETLRLQWGTVVENDLAAFEIYCKEEEEPLSAYHLIGTRLAQGSPEAGAQYQFDIRGGIEPGVAYCFRLKEITIGDQRGDVLDFCGYGLNIKPSVPAQIFAITPTPVITSTIPLTATQPLTLVVTPTATPIIFTIPPTTTAATATASTTITVMNTELPATVDTPDIDTPDIDTIDATPTLVETPTQPENQPTNGSGGLVLPTETPTPELVFTATSAPLDESASISPTIDASVPTTTAVVATETVTTSQASPLPSPTTIVTPASVITDTDTTTTSTDEEQSIVGQTVSEESTPANGELAAGTDGISSPSYIVLTATPIETSAAIVPTYTPFPAAVAVSDVNLITAALPSQNLMVLLLCGVFSGASGLGILGLVTTLLYMRSRNSER